MCATSEFEINFGALAPGTNTAPITTPKTVFVQSLSTQTVDITSSDFDPAGNVTANYDGSKFVGAFVDWQSVGQGTFTQASMAASGDSPVPVGA